MSWLRVSKLLEVSGAYDASWYTAESAERGRIVHQLASDRLLTGSSGIVPIGFEGYDHATEKALTALPFTPLAVERRLSDAVRKITGRPDAIGWLQSRRGVLYAGPCILDFKSGGPQPCHALQLKWYEILADSVPQLRASLPAEYQRLPWQRVGVYLRENGGWHPEVYREPFDGDKCEAMLTWQRWRIDRGLLADPGTAQPEQADDPVAA